MATWQVILTYTDDDDEAEDQEEVLYLDAPNEAEAKEKGEKILAEDTERTRDVTNVEAVNLSW